MTRNHNAISLSVIYIMVGIALAESTVSAKAQEQPRTVKTLKIEMPSREDTALYKLESDGTVRIDWDTVETLASSKADRTMSPFAEVMLAIRDKTWKPMK